MIYHPKLQWLYEFEAGLLTDTSGKGRDLITMSDHRVECGAVSLSGTLTGESVSANITFQQAYIDPVVFAFITTLNGGQFVVPRVRNVTATGCELFMEEPDYEWHATEDVHYLVMEAGVYNWPGGIWVEVGKLSTTASHGSGEQPAGDTVNFQRTHSDPVVLHFLQTADNDTFGASFCHDVTTTSCRLGIEMLETGIAVTTAEEVGYVVFDAPFNQNFDDSDDSPVTLDVGYELASANSGRDDTPHTIAYGGMAAAPRLVVSGMTMNGADGWAPRGETLTATEATVYSDEDQVGDTEQSHAAETFSWVAIETDFKVDARVTLEDGLVSRAARIGSHAYGLIPHAYSSAGAIGDLTFFCRGTIPPVGDTDLAIAGYDRSEYWAFGTARTGSTGDDGLIQVSVRGESSGIVDLVGVGRIDDDIEHFMAFTYEQSTGTVRLYLDGRLDSTHAGALAAGEAIGTGTPRDGMLFAIAESGGGDHNRIGISAAGAVFDQLGYLDGVCLPEPDIKRLSLGLSPLTP